MAEGAGPLPVKYPAGPGSADSTWIEDSGTSESAEDDASSSFDDDNTTVVLAAKAGSSGGGGGGGGGEGASSLPVRHRAHQEQP